MTATPHLMPSTSHSQRSAGRPTHLKTLHALALAVRAGREPMDALIAAVIASGEVHAAVHRQIVDPDMVGDVVQEVLLAITADLDKWDADGDFVTWVWTVSRNNAIDHLRRREVRRARPLPEVPEPEPGRHMSSAITSRQVLTDLISQLPEAYQRPVMLRDVRQLSYDEIAQVLDLSHAAVRQRVTRGRKIVANQWRRTHAV